MDGGFGLGWARLAGVAWRLGVLWVGGRGVGGWETCVGMERDGGWVRFRGWLIYTIVERWVTDWVGHSMQRRGSA